MPPVSHFAHCRVVMPCSAPLTLPRLRDRSAPIAPCYWEASWAAGQAADHTPCRQQQRWQHISHIYELFNRQGSQIRQQRQEQYQAAVVGSTRQLSYHESQCIAAAHIFLQQPQQQQVSEGSSCSSCCIAEGSTAERAALLKAQMHPEEQPFGESGKTGREGHNVICTPPLLVTGCTHVRGPAIQRTYWVITQLMRLAPSVDSLLISV